MILGQIVLGQIVQGVSDVGLIEVLDELFLVSVVVIFGLDDDFFVDMIGMVSFVECCIVESWVCMVGLVGYLFVVVEFFILQGCLFCLFVDVMLGDLVDCSDILVLFWYVDYWDYLGWVDEFVSFDFIKCQQVYVYVWGECGIYMLQMVVGGIDMLIVLCLVELMLLLDVQMVCFVFVLVIFSLQGQGYQIEVMLCVCIFGCVVILLVCYVFEWQVMIKVGENCGVVVIYCNVVLVVDCIVDWDGCILLCMIVCVDQNLMFVVYGDLVQFVVCDFFEDICYVILVQVLGCGGDKVCLIGFILVVI